MMNFAEVNWVDLQPIHEEAEAKLCGVRAAQYGVRMEVCIVHTVTHGPHISWRICSHDHLFMAAGQIPLTPGLALRVAFNEGKQLAIKFAELYASLVL